MGTALDFFLAWVQAAPFSGRDFLTMLTLSRALFAVNAAIQFPLLIRFGYTQVSVLALPCRWRWSCMPVLKLHGFPSIAAVRPGSADWQSRRGRDGGVRARGHHRRPAARALRQARTRRPGQNRLGNFRAPDA
jgi:hypothetical protein